MGLGAMCSQPHLTSLGYKFLTWEMREPFHVVSKIDQLGRVSGGTRRPGVCVCVCAPPVFIRESDGCRDGESSLEVCPGSILHSVCHPSQCQEVNNQTAKMMSL